MSTKIIYFYFLIYLLKGQSSPQVKNCVQNKVFTIMHQYFTKHQNTFNLTDVSAITNIKIKAIANRYTLNILVTQL